MTTKSSTARPPNGAPEEQATATAIATDAVADDRAARVAALEEEDRAAVQLLAEVLRRRVELAKERADVEAEERRARQAETQAAEERARIEAEVQAAERARLEAEAKRQRLEAETHTLSSEAFDLAEPLNATGVTVRDAIAVIAREAPELIRMAADWGALERRAALLRQEGAAVRLPEVVAGLTESHRYCLEALRQYAAQLEQGRAFR
jgi:hypothetical protein